MRGSLRLAIAVLCMAARGAFADPLTGGKSTVDGGGVSFATVGSFQLGGTIGQPDAGALIWMPYVIVGGFWGGSVGATVSVGGPSEPPAQPAPPSVLRILPAMPNPTSSFTSLWLELPVAQEAWVGVYDVRGARVRELVRRELPPGRHRVDWDGRDEQAQAVGAGLYLVHIQLGSLHATQKVAVVR
jgi:hypothetical protein